MTQLIRFCRKRSIYDLISKILDLTFFMSRSQFYVIIPSDSSGGFFVFLNRGVIMQKETQRATLEVYCVFKNSHSKYF